MHVLHVVEYLKLGGIERFLDNVSGKNPEDTFILAFEMPSAEGIADEMLKKGRNVFLMKKKAGHDRNVTAKILELCQKYNISLIHTHDFGPMEYAVEAKIYSPRLKLVHTQHTLHHFISNKKYVWAYNIFGLFYHKLTNVSESVRQTVAGKVFGIKHKLIVIPNGVIVPTSFPTSSTDHSTICIIGVSRLGREKNIETTLRGLSLVKRNFQYTHLGDGDPTYKKELIDLCSDLLLQDKVIFKGMAHNVADYLDQSDIFVSSSKEEGMPLSVLEAMAHGLPCILSDIPAHREICQDGVVIYGTEPHQLADKIESVNEVFHSPQLKIKIWNFVKDNFSIEKMLNDYSLIYQVTNE